MTDLVGYARVSTDKQDAQAQRDALAAAGVPADQIYVNSGLTGSNRARPALDAALAACHDGSTFLVTKLDRLARSISDARDIADELTRKGARLSIGGSVHDPTDPIGRLRGKKPKLSPKIEAHLVAEYRSGNYSIAELAEQYSVGRSTVYRAVQRAAAADSRVADVTLTMPRDN
ncbi:recombinase family protein [Rathayibacter tritici]|uniref:Recombinase n=1 Tax=Rathayibacter tritici TaxID=33888 RepID=A0A160KPX6_9MICO|nr:recombinase family protein [Rathayibacter tritici]AND15247.1 recombinase [Rathayibacter tritici]PPI40997.1 recombinase family protein [Rathayibacter tritici]